MHGDEESEKTVDETANKNIGSKPADTADLTSTDVNTSVNVNSGKNEKHKENIALENVATGLVLDGGGGKGAYQLGVLKALTENHLLDNVVAVSGSSIGAINSVLYAMDDISLMYKAWSDIDMLTLFDVDLAMLTENRLYFSRDEMLKLLDKYIDFDKIRKSKMEIYSTICRVEGDKKTVEYRKLNDCDDARIKDILLASSALPVIYEPVTIDGQKYIDGGVLDNEPVKPLYDKGIRRFIIIGMKPGKVFDASKWSDAEFITIYPSTDIGDFVDGTIDFTDKSVEFREMLGYKDGLRAIKTKFEKNEMYINLESVLAQNDLNEIKMQLRTNTAERILSASINSNIDKFNEIANKYDF
jgi:NTE family protein